MPEKYGVEQVDDTDVKTALEKTLCPVCGTPLSTNPETNVRLCPRCGSKPFESKEL